MGQGIYMGTDMQIWYDIYLIMHFQIKPNMCHNLFSQRPIISLDIVIWLFL